MSLHQATSNMQKSLHPDTMFMTCARFDTVFLNQQIRVARDIRGDTLICIRDGPVREFLS